MYQFSISYTKLLVQDIHLKVKHLGVGTCVIYLREKLGLWLPKARQTVKKIIKECMICRKMNILSLYAPKFSNLPEERLKIVKLFQTTAIDYTGEVTVFESDGSTQTCFIIVYTCMATRAVAADVVTDMTAKTFPMSFKKFANQYTVPKFIYSDNQKSLLASKKYLAAFLVSDDYQEYAREWHIEHVAISNYASWQGGIYECIIKTVKTALYKTIWREKISKIELESVLSDIVNAINDRPITYVHSDVGEIEPLTPNKLLKLSN